MSIRPYKETALKETLLLCRYDTCYLMRKVNFKMGKELNFIFYLYLEILIL